MKRPLAYLAAISIVALVASCLNTLEPGVSVETEEGEVLDITNDEAIAAAREYYERHKEESRVVGGDGDQPLWPWQAKPHAPYDLGEYEIVWSSGYMKSYPGRVLTDFDIIKEHDFIYFPDTCDHYSGMKLRSRFVSVQSPDTTIQYIATYIPHEIYYDRYYSVRHGGGSIGLQEVNFSGRVLHTTLDGYHYAAYRVWQGVITKQVELYNNPLMTMQQRYEEFFNIMENYHVGVCKLSEEVVDESVLAEDDIANTILIEEISIIAPAPKPRVVHYGTIYKYTPDWSTVSSYVKFYNHLGGGGGGGSATEGTLPDSGETPPNVTTPSIDGKTPEEVSEEIFNNYGNLADSVKTKVNTMIAEIAEDCMGKELLSQLMGRNVTFEFSATAPRSRFYHNENKVVLKNNHSEGLMHELFHAYQYNVSCQGNVATYSGLIKNFEAEAYVATYFYMNRYAPNSSAISDRLNSFMTNNPVGTWATLAAKCVDEHGELLEDKSFEDFIYNFEIAGQVAVNDKDIMFFIGEDNTEYYTSIMGLLSSKCD